MIFNSNIKFKPATRFPNFPAHITPISMSGPVPASVLPAINDSNKENDQNPTFSDSLTLFVGNISEDVLNSCMKKILKECGKLINWKRIQGTNGKYQAFGFSDFDDEESTVKALRILNEFELKGKKLVVKAEDNLLAMLLNWLKLKRNSNDKPGYETNMEDHDLYIDEKDKLQDKEILERINRILKDEEETCTSKENRRRRSRSRSKQRHRSRSSSLASSSSLSSETSSDSSYEKEELKKILKKKQENYKHRVKWWERREGKQARYYKRVENELEKRNSTREREKLLKFLATYDDEKEDKEWYSGHERKQRKKYLDRERERDKEDRLAELKEIEMIKKTAEPADERPAPKKSVPEQPICTVVNCDPGEWTSAIAKKDSNDDVSVIEECPKVFNPITTVQGGAQQSLSHRLQNVFGTVDEEDIDNLRTRKRLKPFEISKEERIAHMTEEEKKKKFKDIIHNLPKQKDELFAISVDRNLMDQSWIDRRIRPWVMKQILEFIGEEEKSFCDFICEKVFNESSPYKLMDDVKMILDEDAEVFMIKLWRLIIFETETIKYGLPLPN